MIDLQQSATVCGCGPIPPLKHDRPSALLTRPLTMTVATLASQNVAFGRARWSACQLSHFQHKTTVVLLSKVIAPRETFNVESEQTCLRVKLFG